ncbi:glycosyltransferase [Magnetospirillum sp. SS-4]|uniref:glycosyltransferase n=1 Tax=Magnetospirillum sp. SS-4 TaxID=2681465 RepID=UPI0015734CAC|nr:glycosyltransferase [Magnetospirillum sp. SS-4]
MVVCENGRRLGPGHSLHDLIRQKGRGRYSHWGTTLYFSASDDSDPRSNGRRYTLSWEADDRPVPVLQAGLARNLEGMAADIRRGTGVSAEAVSRLLACGSPDERAWGLRILGDAFLDSGDAPRGAMQLWRAWELGLRRVEIWLPILCWLRETKRDDETRSLFRTAAAAAEAAGDPDWMTDVVVHYETFIYELYPRTHSLPFQDEFVAGPAGRLLSRFKVNLPKHDPATQRPARVGYLLCGEALGTYHHHTDLAMELAIRHDPAVVAPVIISIHQRDTIIATNPFFPQWLEKLETAGLGVYFLDHATAGLLFVDAVTMARSIAALDLDALVLMSQCGLSFVLTALRPARLLMGLGLGEPPLYTSRLLDVAAHFTRRPAMDGLCPSEIMPSFISSDRFALPSRTIPRTELGLDPDQVVLASVGRAMKFDSREYWDLVASALGQCPQARLVVVGIDSVRFAALAESHDLPPDLWPRVHPLGWRDDVINILAICDIYLDTLPYGGGHTVFEALNLGLPVVMVGDDYLFPWDVRTWSPAAELLPPGLGHDRVPEKLAEALTELIRNAGARLVWRKAGPKAVADLKSPSLCARALERIMLDHGRRRTNGGGG